MSSQYDTVAPIGRVFETPVGRFVRLRVWDNGRDAAVDSARRIAAIAGHEVLDVASATPQPMDALAIGRGEPSGGYVVEVQVG